MFIDAISEAIERLGQAEKDKERKFFTVRVKYPSGQVKDVFTHAHTSEDASGKVTRALYKELTEKYPVGSLVDAAFIVESVGLLDKYI